MSNVITYSGGYLVNQKAIIVHGYKNINQIIIQNLIVLTWNVYVSLYKNTY